MKIDLQKFKKKSEDVYRNFWLNLDTSLVGGPGVGKSTWALEQAAFVSSLFGGLKLYYIDTEGTLQTLLYNESLLNKLIESGIEIDAINVSEYIDKHGLLKGIEEVFKDITRIRREVTNSDSPAIMVVDSLSDLRQRLVDAFVEARKGEKESIVELLKKDNRQLIDWNKTTAVLNDLVSIAKNPRIHSIFTSREKLEKDGEVLKAIIDGHKSIEYECDAHLRLKFGEMIVNGKMTKVRKTEVIKIRGIPFNSVVEIEGGFEAFKKLIDSKIKK